MARRFVALARMASTRLRLATASRGCDGEVALIARSDIERDAGLDGRLSSTTA